MYFYQHNIGEFAALTRMMTLDEIGLTMVLIDEYVRTEKPITSETVAMYTDSLATREQLGSESLASRYEKRVLRRVFVETDEGWVCPVIDEQLKKYAARAEVNRANARKPRKKQAVPEAGNTETDVQRIASESLTTNIQYPISNKEEKKGKEKPARFVPEEVTSGEIDRQLYADMIKTRKAPMTATAWDGLKREAERAGMSLESVLRLMVERGWRGFRADWRGVKDQAGGSGSGKEKDLAAMTAEDFESITEEEWTKGLVKNANGTYRWA